MTNETEADLINEVSVRQCVIAKLFVAKDADTRRTRAAHYNEIADMLKQEAQSLLEQHWKEQS